MEWFRVFVTGLPLVRVETHASDLRRDSSLGRCDDSPSACAPVRNGHTSRYIVFADRCFHLLRVSVDTTPSENWFSANRWASHN